MITQKSIRLTKHIIRNNSIIQAKLVTSSSQSTEQHLNQRHTPTAKTPKLTLLKRNKNIVLRSQVIIKDLHRFYFLYSDLYSDGCAISYRQRLLREWHLTALLAHSAALAQSQISDIQRRELDLVTGGLMLFRCSVFQAPMRNCK